MNRVLDPFLRTTGEYAPSLVGAVVVLVIGVLVSWLVAAVVRRLLGRTQLDERLARALYGAKAAQIDSARWVSRGVFWVLVLVSLMGFFQALGFTPITRPLTVAFTITIAFLPRLLAALALGVAAWVVARFLRLVVARAVDALHIEARLARRSGGAATAPPSQPRIGAALGHAAYWLTWLLFLPAILGALELRGILGPVQGMVDRILSYVPNVLTAALILAVAVFIGRVVGGLVTSLLAATPLDRWSERAGFTRAATAAGDTLGQPAHRFAPSRLLGGVAAVVIVLFAAMEAADTIGFAEISTMLAVLLVMLGRVALGLIIFGVGYVIASQAARAVRESGVRDAGGLAMATKAAILVLAGAMALQQMGLANEIILTAFTLMLGGVAVATAIAFGLGGRGVAGRELERLVERAHGRSTTIVSAGGEPITETH